MAPSAVLEDTDVWDEDFLAHGSVLWFGLVWKFKGRDSYADESTQYYPGQWLGSRFIVAMVGTPVLHGSTCVGRCFQLLYTSPGYEDGMKRTHTRTSTTTLNVYDLVPSVRDGRGAWTFICWILHTWIRLSHLPMGAGQYQPRLEVLAQVRHGSARLLPG